MYNVKIVQTAKDTENKLKEVSNIQLTQNDNNIQNIIEIADQEKYQKFNGFGGAFTESSADTFYKMGEENRKRILNAYFDNAKGNNYKICRTHINSCDFSLENYSYDDTDGDVELKDFSIERDKRQLIPLIKEAMRVSKGELKLFASPWSPPAWMKSNKEMNNGGKILPEFKKAWARYYAKYIKAYAKEGIKIDAITVQNEPEAKQVWDSCLYTAEEERDFVRDYLGPTLIEEGLADVKIIIWDHNKDHIYERAKTILSDKKCEKYVWGIGFHWYSGDQFENLDKTHADFPDKKLVFTEGCQEGGVHLGSWQVGERYAHDIIGDLNNWTVSWTDWNMILNEKGGPNHVGNLCDAPIIADTVNDKLYFQNSYYYIGHFSRFIESGAVRIGCKVNAEGLEAVAFKNPDGKITVVVLNRTDRNIDFKLKIAGNFAKISCLKHSIMTLILQQVI